MRAEAKSLKIIAIEEARNYEKLYLSKIYLKMPDEGDRPTYP